MVLLLYAMGQSKDLTILINPSFFVCGKVYSYSV